MGKKNILITIPGLHHGGTNRSLWNMLTLIDLSVYEIDLFVLNHEGEYKGAFKNCTILSPNRLLRPLVINLSTEKNIFRKLYYVSFKAIRRFFKCIGYDFAGLIFRHVSSSLMKKKYDTVIAFQEGTSTHFVSTFKNTRKIAWIRCDYKSYLSLTHGVPEKDIYTKFDYIICVSQFTKQIFQDLIPEVKEKVISLHNIINYASIIQMSQQKENIDPLFSTSEFKILSIGRIDPVKRFTEIPSIASKLKKRGLTFKWFIIGSGGSKNEIKKLHHNIEKYDVEDHLILLGEKKNPYPYILNANLLVSTSLSEACPNVINEAKILHTPVVATDFGSVHEFIENGINGDISSIDKISDKIAYIIQDDSIYQSRKNNLKTFTYNNEEQLKTLYKIL